MAIAQGVSKQLRYKKESSWGVAPGATGGQQLRRVTSNIDLAKETYGSEEIRTDAQDAEFRHGVRSVTGSINGEVSVGTWNDFYAAALRQAFQTAATTGALINVTAQTAAPQYVRAAGSFLTDGFKVGDVIRWTGWTVATENNSRNFLITALTATDMTGVHLDGTAVGAKASGDSVTGTVEGKKTWVPTTGHTNDSFAFEHWYSDIAQDELFLGCKIQDMQVSLPPTGIATVAMNIMGKNIQTGTSAYYTSPAAVTTGGSLASVNGAIYVGGTAVALLTGLDFTITGNTSAEPVVGSNVYPDIFLGRVQVEGNATIFFEDATYRDIFVNETESSIVAVFTADNTATSGFTSFIFPRIKSGGSGKDDGEKGIVQTVPFKALINTSAGASEQTTIVIQDSAAV